MHSALRSDNLAINWAFSRLPTAASIIAVILVAFAVARLAWLLLAPPQTYQPIQPTSETIISSAVEQDEINTDLAIASLHLFGEAPAVQNQLSQNAPDTRLNLRLLGMLATDDDSAYAIIASGNSGEEFYKVGADIPGGAILKAVHTDRILINRAGQIETLRLPRDKIEGFVETNVSNQNAPEPDASNAIDTADPDVNLGELRREMLKDPQRMSQMISVVPEQINGVFSGFRVSPQGDQRLFGQLGLQAGDIVTSINGIAMDAPQQGLLALQDLAAASDVTLTVVRDGNEVTLFRSFDK